MKYIVHTDGACNREKRMAAAAFVIQTPREFIRSGSKVIPRVSILTAEIAAIGLAAKCLLEECDIPEGSNVVIKTDSQYALDFFLDSKSEEPEPYYKEGAMPKEVTSEIRIESWKSLQALSLKYNCKLMKINGHLEAFNANKVADRLAKYALGVNTR